MHSEPNLPQSGTANSFEYPQIAIVDQRRFARECLETILDVQPWSIRSYQTVQEAIENEPDLVILNIAMRNEQALRDLQMHVHQNPSVKFLIFTDNDSKTCGAQARDIIQSGVKGFLSTRDSTISMLAAAVEFVLNGGIFLPVSLILGADIPVEATTKESDKLTVRQTEVFERLRQGKPNKIIAFELGMSESTAKVHIRTIMSKLGARNRTEAVFRRSELIG